MPGSKRSGSKRYSVSKNEELWIQQQLNEETPKVVINGRQRAVKNNVQIWLTLIPVLEVFLPSIALICSYVIGRLNHDIKPWPYLPYASQTGFEKPQSCVFTLGVSSSAFLTLLVVLLRYNQVSLLHDGFFNKFSLVTGVLAALSKLVIASFQYDSVSSIHYVAVGSYFFFSFLFYAVQVYLTRKTTTISSKVLYLTRLILTESILVIGVVFGAFFSTELSYMNNAPKNVGQISQWILLALINIYSLTFIKDLRQILFCFDIWLAPHSNEETYCGGPKTIQRINSTLETTLSQYSCSGRSTYSSRLEDSNNEWNGRWRQQLIKVTGIELLWQRE